MKITRSDYQADLARAKSAGYMEGRKAGSSFVTLWVTNKEGLERSIMLMNGDSLTVEGDTVVRLEPHLPEEKHDQAHVDFSGL